MMNEAELWIYFDGPEPSHLKPLFDSMRATMYELPPLSQEDSERLGQSVMKRIDEAISRRAESSASGKSSLIRSHTIAEDEPNSEEKPSSAPDTAHLLSQEGPTARSPSFDESIPVWPPSAPKPQRASVEVHAARPPESLTITEQIYHRYRVVNYAARVALDEHWKSHFEERPEARARFEEAFAQYISWVRDAGRK